MPEIILTVIYTVLFLLLMHWIPFFRNSKIRFGWLLAFFLLKVIAGETAWWIYTYVPYFQDSSDAFRYYTDGHFLYDIFFKDKEAFFSIVTGIDLHNPRFTEYYSQMISWNRVYETAWFNDNRFMIRFNALADFISFGNYHINLLIVNILSFTGLLHIYNFFSEFVAERNRAWLLLFLFLLPCLVFWGSIVSKESLAIFAVGILVTGLRKARWYRPGFYPYLLLFIGLILLFSVKYYLVFLIFPVLFAFLLNEKENCPNPANRYMTFISWFFTITMIINIFLPSFDPAYWLMQQQKNFFGLADFRHETTPLSGILETTSVLGLSLKSPLAFLSSCISLYFPPVNNSWGIVAMLENSLIIILIFWMLSKRKERVLSNNVFLFVLVFLLMDFVAIGFTTPYAGAIHRYRIISMPLFLAGLASLTDRKPFPFLLHFLKPNKQNINE